MLLDFYAKIKALPKRHAWAALIVQYLPLAIELLATVWMVTSYGFEPVIPVYQGY